MIWQHRTAATATTRRRDETKVRSLLRVSQLLVEVMQRVQILYWILTFINHTCLWVNSQLNRFNKRHAGRSRQSTVCASYTSVRKIIMEILRGRWTLITAQNKSGGDMKIDRIFSPSRLQVEYGIETKLSVRTSQVILLLERDSDYAG